MEKSGAKKPAFIWQGLLIVLPLLLLAAFGLYSLRQDKMLAENEARERCGRLAQELANAGAKELPEQLRQQSEKMVNSPITRNLNLTAPIVLDSQGNLFSIDGSTNRVKFVNDPISRPLPVSILSPEQLQLWHEAQKNEFAAGQMTLAIDSYRKLIALQPPQPFLSEAKYALAILLIKNWNGVQGDDEFFDLLKGFEKDPTIRSENGLSFYSLLLYQLYQDINLHNQTDPISRPYILHGKNGLKEKLGLFWGDPTEHPSFLTPALLEATAELERKTYSPPFSPHADQWLRVWEQDNQARNFYRDLKSELAGEKLPSKIFWTKWNDRNWLVLLQPNDSLPAGSGRQNQFLGTAFDDSGTKNAASSLVASSRTSFQTDPAKFYLLLPYSEDVVRKAIQHTLAFTGLTLPDYTELGVELVGRAFPEKSSLPLLGTALAKLEVLPVSVNGFTVNLYLSKPALLYAHQRQRTLLFGGLILISALAAAAGLFRAYRSFQQQLRLNEMKSNFVSSVSHELRAPVASMRLMAEALDRGKISDPPKQKEYFRFIVQECRRLSSLVENILDFSRIEQGRKEYQFEPTDIQALVEQTVKLMEPYAAERQVTLRDHSQPSTLNPQLSCDGLALQQALINLLDNAIKHSTAGAIVNVGLETSEACVQLWIEDKGPGIPSEEHGKIFERFYRRGSELRRETQGIGIGLTIVKHIVAAHGGRVIVQSAVGQGSRFTIELPANNKTRKET